MPITIRFATEDDIPAICDLVNAFAALNLMLPRHEHQVRAALGDFLVATERPDGEANEDGDEGGFDEGGGSGDDLYDRAVAVVTRDKKASTSYVQRRLQIGYNRAASLIERMENEGVVSPANHAGKREVLAGPPP